MKRTTSDPARTTSPDGRGFRLGGVALGAIVVGYILAHPGFALGVLHYQAMKEVAPLCAAAPESLERVWRLMNMQPIPRALLHAVLLLGWTALQVACAGAARLRRGWARSLMVGSLAAAVVLACGMPIYSTDVATYQTIAELREIEGLDPYAAHPADHPELPSRRLSPGVGHGSIYGTFATALFGWLRFTNHFGVNVVAWRFAMIALLALAVVLLHDAWKQLGRSRETRASSLVLVAWSPLLLLEGALNGHVDVVAMLLLALGVQQIARGKELLGLAALASTIAVKLTYGVLLPAILARAFLSGRAGPGRWARPAIVLSAALAFYFVWLLPGDVGTAHLEPLRSIGLWTAGSPLRLAKMAAKQLGLDPRTAMIPWALAAAAVFLRGLGSVRERSSFFRRISRDYLLWALVFSPIFYPWYLLPAFALVSVSDHEMVRRALPWLGAAALVVVYSTRMSFAVTGALGQILPVAALALAFLASCLASRKRTSV